MGTSAHVIVHGDSHLLGVARARIEELEQRWSRFLPTSELSELNTRDGKPTRVSEDTFMLIEAGVEAWRATGGAFDPTVLGDVVRAGYDETFEQVRIRGGHGTSAQHRDCGGISLEPTSSTVTVPPDVGFDPGGIGKGLAADIVVEELVAAGARGACVNLGGDLRVEGTAPGDGRWIVAVADPATDDEIATVALTAGAVATSTTAKRAWMAGGTRMHHLIDPATSAPAVSDVVSATALARTAVGAEVAAKAALLAAPGAALDEIARLGCDGIVTTRAGRHAWTPGFAAFALDPVA
jgi:thiamine biosynthesis lipoprotein